MTLIIDDADKARRLARAICSDVVLYHDAVKQLPREQRGARLAEPVAEARALFVSRVAPGLAPIFDEALATFLAPAFGIDAGDIVAGPLAPASVEMPGHGVRGFESDVEPTRARRRASSVPVFAAVLFLVLAGLCAYFLPRLHW